MSDDYQPDKPVWKSYVWYKDTCYFVSTIERTYSFAHGDYRGKETMAWEYDWKKGERGELLMEAAGIHHHEQICRSILAVGILPEPDKLV